MQIGDIMIPAEITDILDALKVETGEPRLYKVSGRNIQIPCPYHKDGEERKPSCGILSEDVWVKGKLYKEGQVHCFTCGETAEFIEYVSHAFGKNDGGKTGYRWLVKNFLSIEIESRNMLKVDMSRKSTRTKNATAAITYIDEEELDAYRYTHSYMYERKLTDEIIELFDIGYDKDERAITFPVHYHKNGKVLMIQRRSVVSKFFKNPSMTQKTLTLYGLWQVLQALKDGEVIDHLYITESITDALTVWVYGGYGVSLMGLGGYEQYALLRNLPVRKLIKALDNDAYGKDAMVKLTQEMKGEKLLFDFAYPRGKKDMNELTYAEFIRADKEISLI